MTRARPLTAGWLADWMTGAQALTEWVELNSQHPNIPHVLMHLARTKSQSGRLPEAREAAAQVTAQDEGLDKDIYVYPLKYKKT